MARKRRKWSTYTRPVLVVLKLSKVAILEIEENIPNDGIVVAAGRVISRMIVNCILLAAELHANYPF
jgi:hypothetical protein